MKMQVVVMLLAVLGLASVGLAFAQTHAQNQMIYTIKPGGGTVTFQTTVFTVSVAGQTVAPTTVTVTAAPTATVLATVAPTVNATTTAVTSAYSSTSTTEIAAAVIIVIIIIIIIAWAMMRKK